MGSHTQHFTVFQIQNAKYFPKAPAPGFIVFTSKFCWGFFLFVCLGFLNFFFNLGMLGLLQELDYFSIS